MPAVWYQEKALWFSENGIDFGSKQNWTYALSSS